MSEVAVHSQIQGSIHRIRGRAVMIDRDIAMFYGVPLAVLNRAVRRVADRFPEEFMFPLTEAEAATFAPTVAGRARRRVSGRDSHRPYAFTEEGIHAMSYFLRSPRARQISVELIRLFHSMRNIVDDYQSLHDTLQQVKKQQEHDTKRLWEVARSIHQLEQFREEVGERILRGAQEEWRGDPTRQRLETMRYELSQIDRNVLKHRDLFYIFLTIFGVLLTALLLLPR